MKQIEMPARIARLPQDDKGRPVPWFVEWIDGKPDFRVMDRRKLAVAYLERKCWVCGEPLGKYVAFVIGPMCAINHTSAEPPSHRDCAIFSARACPFLSTPKMHRNQKGLPEVCSEPGGIAIKRNPGVTLVWVTFAKDYGHISTPTGPLFKFGDALVELLWFCEGRPAARAEILHSIQTGIPILRELAIVDGPEAEADLDQKYWAALQLVPAE